MIRQVQVQKYQTNFNYTNTVSHGGFLSYWKLIPKLFKMATSMPATFIQRFRLVTVFICKLPWWAVIKPLGWAFSSKTQHEGTYLEIRHNGEIKSQEFSNESKLVICYFLSIPYWAYSGKFNQKDKTYLINKLQKGQS